MSDLIEIASRVMQTAELRLEQTAGNLANTATAGYRSGAVFSDLVGPVAPAGSPDLQGLLQKGRKNIHNFDAAGVVSTGSALDLSIAGDGYFRVRTDQGEAFTRAGRFERSPDGLMVTAEGYALLDVSGGDIRLQSAVPGIAQDGTVTEGGIPSGRIGIYSFGGRDPEGLGGGVLFAAPEGAVPVLSDAAIRQGVYEGSNVSVSAEMIEMMRAVKQAESGARLAQAYDGLLGQAITTFGQRK